jgi:hypothetical protein
MRIKLVRVVKRRKDKLLESLKKGSSSVKGVAW